MINLEAVNRIPNRRVVSCRRPTSAATCARARTRPAAGGREKGGDSHLILDERNASERRNNESARTYFLRLPSVKISDVTAHGDVRSYKEGLYRGVRLQQVTETAGDSAAPAPRDVVLFRLGSCIRTTR